MMSKANDIQEEFVVRNGKYFTPYNKRTKRKRSLRQMVPRILVGKFWRHYKDGKESKRFYVLISHSRFIWDYVFDKHFHKHGNGFKE